MKLQPSCHTEQISAQHETRLGELWKNWWLMDSMQTLCTTPCFIRWTPSSHSISRSPGESSFHSETGVSVSGPWEWSEQWEGAPSLALAKQGWRAFVCASAPRIASSSWKTRHKEAAEEPDKPPPVSSRTCHDSPRPDRGQSSSSRGPFVFLIIQITTWGEIRAGPGSTDYVLSCSCSSTSLQGVSIPCRTHLECGSQQLCRLPGTPLCRGCSSSASNAGGDAPFSCAHIADAPLQP